MKFLQVWWSSLLRQLRGHPTSTVLCCSPPRPLDWMRCDMPSRTLQEVTTWQKPLTFSASINRRIDWAGGAERGKSHQAAPPPHLPLGRPFSPGARGTSAPQGQAGQRGRSARGGSAGHTSSARWTCRWLSRKVPSSTEPTMVSPLPAFSWLVRESS